MNRKDRSGCEYDCFVPDALDGWRPVLPADVVADLADAEAACRRLNEAGTGQVSLEGLARFLLRAESVASSRIEGLDAGPRRLLDAELGESSDRVAVEVLGNIQAMTEAVDMASGAGPLTTDQVLSIHRTLMERSPAPEFGGVVRTTQNWIGGSSYNPCSAAYVPPPPEYVEPLLDDLVAYLNGDDHPALLQAAVAHAQFETIHPFADGNGRTGRALIHIVLRRRGVAPHFVPPISLVLATWSRDYIGGLTAYRHQGSASSPKRSEAAQPWMRTFAAATTRSCADAERYAERIADLQVAWREQLGRVRANSALELLLERIPGTPVLTVESACRLTGRSEMRAGEAINRLVDAGVLRQRNVGRRRYRVFEATQIVELFTGLERALASPTGDTAAAPPVRHVPPRRTPG